MHVIAAKAVAFKEALGAEFVDYQKETLANARAMVTVFIERGYDVVSGGTDDHLFLVSWSRRGSPARMRMPHWAARTLPSTRIRCPTIRNRHS